MKMMKWKMKMNAALCSVDDNSNQSNTINFAKNNLFKSNSEYVFLQIEY